MYDQGQDNYGGGGFYASPSQFGTPSGEQKKDVRRQMNVVPATIHQILEAEEDGLRIADVDVHLVTIVGLVKSVAVSSTKIACNVQDDTGTVECNLFLAPKSDGKSHPPTVESTYVRVVGSIRSSRENRHLMALSIKPLKELNELTTHLLEVMHLAVNAKKLKEKALKSADNNPGLANSLMGANFDGRSGTNMNTHGDAGGMMNGLNPQQQIVYNAIQNCIENAGIHKDDIANLVRGRVTPREIDGILEFLSNEGHIYSTIDEEHFKTTESC